MKNLIAFDLVGTLTDKDALYQRLHKIANCKDKAIENVDRYRKGEFDEKELIKRNVQFHINAGITEKIMKDEVKRVMLRDDVKELIQKLKKNNYVTCLITSDYDIAAQKIKKELKVDYAFGCEEVFKEGKLKGCSSIIDGQEK